MTKTRGLCYSTQTAHQACLLPGQLLELGIVIGSIGVGIGLLVMVNEQSGAVIDQCLQFTCLTS